MANIVLTARRISPNPNRDLTNPKMSLLQTELIVKAKPFKKGISLLYGPGNPYRKYRMAETPQEYEVAQRIAAGLTSVNSANVAASGSASGTSQAITAYHNVVTGATASTQTGLSLAAAANKFNNGGAVVVRNDTNVALSVYPSSGEFIDGLAANVPVQVPAFGRVHFYASASNKWLSATVYE